MDTQDKRVFRFGPFEADLGNRQVFKNGITVGLAGQPFDVLALLLENPGQLVTRQQLRTRLWPSGTVVEFDHGIHVAVTKVREALGDDPERPRFIATVPRHGYRFIAPVTPLAAPAYELASAVSPVSLPSAALHATRRFRFASLPLVLLIAATAVAVWVGWPYLAKHERIVPYSAGDRRMTFALLPLHAAPDDPIGMNVARNTLEAMSLAFEKDTLWTRVAPRRDVERVIGRLTDNKSIARALDVHFLVRGLVERATSGYIVTLILLDGAADRVLGSRSFTLAVDAAARPRYVDTIDVWFGLLNPAVGVEVKQKQDKPLDALDARDLALRAYSIWIASQGSQPKQGYASASELLSRARALAPNDLFVAYLTTKINLCDCALAWSHNPEQQRAIGSAALEDWLRADPSNTKALEFKVGQLQLSGRYEESVVVADSVLRRDPNNGTVLDDKAVGLLKVGRAQEAEPIADALANEVPDKWPRFAAHAADVHYALGDYAAAARLAYSAVARMSQQELSNPVRGTIRLTLAASEANLGHRDRASAVMVDFRASVPQARTIAAIRNWMNPMADLYGFEPLFAGLRLAGVPDGAASTASR